MSDRTWIHLENHLRRDQERDAAIEQRIRELADKYDVPWSDVVRSMDRAQG